MESPTQLAHRLLTSLEELIEQEGTYLRGGHYDLAVEVRERSEPLVSGLVGIAGLPGVGDLGPRVRVVVERSDQHGAYLQEKIQALGAELQRNDQARHRAAQVAPAYARRSPGSAAPRFQAAG